MLYIIYGFILLFLFIIIYGAWSRKRVFNEVDRLENKKLQLMNEPITEELSKIKGLKMLGETEERFEQWREEWDHIVTVQLPNMEEKLFDIEEFANKYRFNKAKQNIKLVDEELEAVEQQMNDMVEEVDQLVHSEEQNRQDIHIVKDEFDETKKKLWVQKGTLGQAGSVLEQKMQGLQDMFSSFEEQTEEGNYFQARETLLTIQSFLEDYDRMIDLIPQYLVKIEKDLPKQLEELENGLEEMQQNGYALHHFSFGWLTEDMKRRLKDSLPLLEHLKLDEAAQPIESIEQEINDIYEKLEHEVLSRNFVEKELPVLRERLYELPSLFQALRAETETIKLNYQLNEAHDEQQLKIEKQIKELTNQYAVIEDASEENKQSFTTLRKMTQDFVAELENVENEVQETKENLNHLRSDERKAEEAISELKTTLLQGQKNLRKHNIPGVPENIIFQLDEAEKNLYEASYKLKQIPISMNEVNHKVEKAREHVDECMLKLTKTIDQAKLAEAVIKYGNRYRRHHDQVNIKLLQAEDRFRRYLYEEALEMATDAVESVDPNAIEKIKEQENLLVSNS
ncbi:septation ring formation regulator EzrA [Salipaludibacillus keqinensis]|uniref:Septation ring formation regulator EzrA n=1 Tax=Salipaludibacillus keqinensis TaxID=2045207 RepID=A0A323TFX8_9BACI|nr:septation ring formation regulator EzrA [Salipaludibacillus keqinensis]PYZ93771.1 septation ring formation regulator EzrA [Salipaludibacillus keqinensis]